jgi:hypothetical protein
MSTRILIMRLFIKYSIRLHSHPLSNTTTCIIIIQNYRCYSSNQVSVIRVWQTLMGLMVGHLKGSHLRIWIRSQATTSKCTLNSRWCRRISSSGCRHSRRLWGRNSLRRCSWMGDTCKYSSKCSSRCSSKCHLDSSKRQGPIRISNRQVCHRAYSSLNREFLRCREYHRDSSHLHPISWQVHLTLQGWLRPSHSLCLRFSNPNSHNSSNSPNWIRACLLNNLKPRRIIKLQKIAHLISKLQRPQIRRRPQNNPTRLPLTKVMQLWTKPPHLR